MTTLNFDFSQVGFPDLVERFLSLQIPMVSASRKVTWGEFLEEAQAANQEVELNDLPFTEFLASPAPGGKGWSWGDAILASMASGTMVDIADLFSHHFRYEPLDFVEVLHSCGVPLAELALA